MGQLSVTQWILMVSMYLVMLPGMIVVFYAIWRYGPEVANEAKEKENARKLAA